MNLYNLFENDSEEKCPHCNGPMFSELMINEKKDACYYKVKSRYKVWPSAYASGALVKCRKKGADSWGNKSESVAESMKEAAKSNAVTFFRGEPILSQERLNQLKSSIGKPYPILRKEGSAANIGTYMSPDGNKATSFVQQALAGQGKGGTVTEIQVDPTSFSKGDGGIDEAVIITNIAGLVSDQKPNENDPLRIQDRKQAMLKYLGPGVQKYLNDPLLTDPKMVQRWYNPEFAQKNWNTIKSGKQAVTKPGESDIQERMISVLGPLAERIRRDPEVISYFIGHNPGNWIEYNFRMNSDGSGTKVVGVKYYPPAKQGVSEDQLDENLRQWFKEKWVRFGPDGKIRGDCARGDDSEGKPKCLPQAKAQALGKKGRASAAARKRREDPNPERRGAAHNVATKSESSLNEFAPGSDDGNDGFSDEILKRLAAQWWQGDEDPRVERTLAAAGWEIGQDEGYDNGGVFVVMSGDEHGRSYMSWPAAELEGLAEGYYNDIGPEYGGAGKGRSEDALMTAKLTRQAKAAAKKAGKTFNTSAEYRLWHDKQKEKQGVAEGLGQINEYRDRMYQYIKSIVPTWPDYVVKDWLYANFARGNVQTANYSFDTLGKDLPNILADAGLSTNTRWQLVPDMKFTMDMWEPKTLKQLQARAGGSSKSTDPDVHIPAKDAERHATQAALAQQQGGVRKEPVIIVKTPYGYKLLEGWHRTIQHFHKFPDGYTGPAYVAVAQGQQGVAEEVNPEVTSDKYTKPSQNVRMGDFVFNARTFTGGLGAPNAKGLQIRAYDPKNLKSSIGSADFIVKTNKKGKQWLESDDTEVNDEYRGQGVATMMYTFAKSLGNDIKPSDYQSNAGGTMWKKWGSDAKHLGQQGVAEGKVKLYTDPSYFGAEVDDAGFDSLPVVNIPTNRLVGFEPDSKMQQPKAMANVKNILAGLEQGDNIPPILVRKYKNGYQVLDGHHRFWAYKVAKKDTIPARVVDPKDIEEVGKQGVAEAQTDYQKRRQRERDVDAGKPVKPPPKNPQNDYFARRKKERDMAESVAFDNTKKSDRVGRGPLRNFNELAAMLKINDRILVGLMSLFPGFPKPVSGIRASNGSHNYYRPDEFKRWVIDNGVREYIAKMIEKRQAIKEDQAVQLSPNISARPNQDPDSPEDYDYFYKDMQVMPGQDFHTQIKDQHLRQMDPAYNTMRAAFDNPIKPGTATPYKEPKGDTIIPVRPQEPEMMKDTEGNPVRLKDYVPHDPRISESRLYYPVIGTADKDLRSDFGMRKDKNGWYLKESSSPKYKMMAQRAFGSPKLQEYNFPAGQASKGSEGVISPVGSIPRN
jgi:hypothetical protein